MAFTIVRHQNRWFQNDQNSNAIQLNFQMSNAKKVRAALNMKINKSKADFYPRFFKTGPGEYGEGDKFLGVVVPDQRKIARQFKDLELAEVRKLLDSPMHECRLTGLFILVSQYERAKTESARSIIYKFYVHNFDAVNNWDLVDATAHKILGPYLQERSRKPLYTMARARHLWKNRAAMVATYHYIRQDDFSDTLELSELLLSHKHDLIHKAVGWMLREMGKRDDSLLRQFLKRFGTKMPRIMLRYAIEKLPKAERDIFLKKP